MLKVVKSVKKKEKKKSYVYMMFFHPCWNRKVRNNILNWTVRWISEKSTHLLISNDHNFLWLPLLIPILTYSFCTLVNIQFIAFSHVTWLSLWPIMDDTLILTSNITLAPCCVFIFKSMNYLNILLISAFFILYMSISVLHCSCFS